MDPRRYPDKSFDKAFVGSAETDSVRPAMQQGADSPYNNDAGGCFAQRPSTTSQVGNRSRVRLRGYLPMPHVCSCSVIQLTDTDCLPRPRQDACAGRVAYQPEQTLRCHS
jgi:hypothetical protein